MPNTISKARDVLLEACGVPAGEEGFKQLRLEAERLQQQPLSPSITPFVLRVVSSEEPSTALDSVLALVANRPPRTWSDNDVDQFPALARQIGRLFREAQADSWYTTAQESTQPLTKQEQIVNRLRTQLDMLPRDVRRETLQNLLDEIENE